MASAALRPQGATSARPGPTEGTRAPRVLIAATAAAALGASLPAAPALLQQDWLALAFLGVIAMVSERFDINLYGDSRISISGLFLLTAAIAIGPQAVIVMAPCVAVAGHVGRGRPPHKLLFNASIFLLGSLASAWIYQAGAHTLPAVYRLNEALAAVSAALADYLISSVCVALVIAATSTATPRQVWVEKFAWLFPHYALHGGLAFVLLLAYEGYPGVWGMLGFVAPVLMARLTMKQYVQRTERSVNELHEKNASIVLLSDELKKAYEDTLVALTSALDHRDTETKGHSTRVAEISVALGEILGIGPGSQEWLDLKHGAMLHDVGKIAVPDAILRKPGSLTPEEWAIIRRHPEHGHEIVSEVKFLRGAASLVLHHHERFDGGGYPSGWRGEEIPLGARIFAVADTFDAITYARPYSTARSADRALAEILRCSGTQFDPRVVQALVSWYARQDGDFRIAA